MTRCTCLACQVQADYAASLVGLLLYRLWLYGCEESAPARPSLRVSALGARAEDVGALLGRQLPFAPYGAVSAPEPLLVQVDRVRGRVLPIPRA